MTHHPARERLAEIVVTRPGEEPTRGSGYLVAAGRVLTAFHVVREATSIGAWLGAPEELREEACLHVDVRSVVKVEAADLALLRVTGSGGRPVAGERALVGRLDRDSATSVQAVAAGFPRHKLRPAPGRPGVRLREARYVWGSISGASNPKTRTYALEVRDPPDKDSEADRHSPWEGMSGAAVWSGQRLIGIVGQHHPAEGPGTLTVRPIDELYSRATEDQLREWQAELPQLPEAAERLVVAAPRSARARGAEQLAPPVLIGRDAELADLGELAESDVQWLWVKGEAFAGKTALLAWFTLHPPERVDVVSCFLRRTLGENTAAYALDVLTHQLAALAGRGDHSPSSPHLSDQISTHADLLHEANSSCVQRDRRLLLLIDGLDEYDRMSAPLRCWLPPAGATLPKETLLLVSSRTGVDIDLPPDHPLLTHVWPIAASETASGIRDAAHEELDCAFREARRYPGGFLRPLVSVLAAAGSGLTAGELAALLRRRGKDADIGEVEDTLGSSLGRSLMCLGDPDTADQAVYAFAHDTLLTEARRRCAADLTSYEDLVDGWADEYTDRGFPVDTPQYLLRPYSRELSRRAADPDATGIRCRQAVDRLFRVVAHPARAHRLFERTGNPAVAGQEIETAQRTISQTRRRSGLERHEVLFRLAVLALRRQPILAIGDGMAADIAVVRAHLGRARSSLDLATGIEDPERQVEALDEVVPVLAAAGQDRAAAQAAERALQAATGINDPARRVSALWKAAHALDLTGQADQASSAAEQALRAAVGINSPGALSTAVQCLAEAGHVEQAFSTAEQALEAATSIDDPAGRAWALSEVARILAAAGLVSRASSAAERAFRVTADISDSGMRTEALWQVVGALAATGQVD